MRFMKIIGARRGPVRQRCARHTAITIPTSARARSRRRSRCCSSTRCAMPPRSTSTSMRRSRPATSTSACSCPTWAGTTASESLVDGTLRSDPAGVAGLRRRSLRRQAPARGRGIRGAVGRVEARAHRILRHGRRMGCEPGVPVVDAACLGVRVQPGRCVLATQSARAVNNAEDGAGTAIRHSDTASSSMEGRCRS